MFQKLIDYIKNSIRELKKVVWPTRKEVGKHTLLIIGVSLGVAIFLGIIDFFLTKIIQFFI